MSDIGKYPRGHGYAWRGNWKARLGKLIRAHGCSSVSEYVDARPGRSFLQLADDLGGGDVAAVQLEVVLVEEARVTDTLEWRCRDFLARAISSISGGWPGPSSTRTREQDWTAMMAISGWAPSNLDEMTSEHRIALGTALLKRELPAGWRPSGADDPVLVELFAALPSRA